MTSSLAYRCSFSCAGFSVVHKNTKPNEPGVSTHALSVRFDFGDTKNVKN